MILIEEEDLRLALSYVANRDIKDIETMFRSKNRGELLKLISECINVSYALGLNSIGAILNVADFVYILWDTYYKNQKTIEEIFGETDFCGMDDSIVDLINKNMEDNFGDNYEKLVDSQIDRLNTSIKENEKFFTMIEDITFSYFNDDVFRGGVLAFLTIEERMKRLKKGE